MKIELTRKKNHKHWYAMGTLVVVALIATFLLNAEDALVVSSGEVDVLKVEQGNIDLFSHAFGELFSEQERLLTSQASGKVAEIYLRPGASVEPSTVILSLANPELNRAYQSAVGDYNGQKVQLESFELEQQNERLDYQSRMADIEAALERGQLELSVNKQLSERGVSAKLEIQRAELTVKQEAKKLEFERQKYQHFLKVQAFQLKQRQIELEQLNQQVALLSNQLDDMQVKAGIYGTLQSLEVGIGETLPQGTVLGRVGSVDKLLARLRVPQHQVDQITLGAPVELTTRKGQISGEVNLIESVVSNGVVIAEVKLTSELPSDARPLAPVTGQIFIKTQINALYVTQNAGLRPMSQLDRFVLGTDKIHAVKRRIQLGGLTKGKLIIQSGVDVDEHFISQMQDEWSVHDLMTIREEG
ncbi:HlyD family efflux transporter periplasmic adaptor subunit [Alteromonas sp. CI.11.F.A3]|uniref:efflux RND transporter periplasmic adaptor subunit n=1 Tax=unclassified Alteromonas TaxID=2614992 RepID=UPI001B3A17FA|nr:MULTISPECIES: HlyD family efflux transporter periplasmic adaptor subunit [unclassified Alteromonas]MBQ4831328.1 HlyD family efflux transporter periplasmic adaptor subunit [Alteromonas sp. MMG017]WOI38560.1 HlyD family efflux transporter periplasmic adaptor subunit [Alteromonas sp. CI.11.F.A3]